MAPRKNKRGTRSKARALWFWVLSAVQGCCKAQGVLQSTTGVAKHKGCCKAHRRLSLYIYIYCVYFYSYLYLGRNNCCQQIAPIYIYIMMYSKYIHIYNKSWYLLSAHVICSGEQCGASRHATWRLVRLWPAMRPTTPPSQGKVWSCRRCRRWLYRWLVKLDGIVFMWVQYNFLNSFAFSSFMCMYTWGETIAASRLHIYI